MNKIDKQEKPKKSKKKIKKTGLLESHFNGIVVIFLAALLLLLILSQVEIYQLRQSMTDLSFFYQDIIDNNMHLRDKIIEQNEKIDLVNKQFTDYRRERITRDQFTEIYMQLQELTGMISEENKREFYIGRIVNIVSSNNSQLESETIYEISKNIYEISLQYNFNPLLTCALIKVESNFIVDSVSDAYAFGLCQVRRFIARELAENIGIKWDGAEKTLFDPVKNIKIGMHYLSLLYDDFGDMKLALTAYNYGPFKVQELMSQESEIPNNYSERVLDYYAQYRGFDIEQIDEILYREMEE
jgi:soluble lytic murein transglycosylase